MMDRRSFLGRAAVLLGTLVALPAVTLGTTHTARPVSGACEPDGTSVDGIITPTTLPWQRLEAELDQYARPWGYGVTLERVIDRNTVAAFITSLDPRRDDRCCIYVPAATLPHADVYLRTQVAAMVRQMTVLRAARWTE